MSGYEVSNPILNAPYAEPQEHWHIEEGKEPKRQAGRRKATYFFRDPKTKPDQFGRAPATQIELIMVNRIRQRVKAWREEGYPGASRITLELLGWWRREGRRWPLFFAQLEAAETIIFLVEARADFRQGIQIPREPVTTPDAGEGFLRYACKMATGSGKTTVMGMLAAWSILNKLNDPGDARFSDVVLVVCPNVTIRDRLAELDPEHGDASLYVTRDLVPPHIRSDLSRGKVIVTNWHTFEPGTSQVGGASSKVIKTGKRIVTRDLIHIGPKTTTARGSRYLTEEDFTRQVDAGMIEVIEEQRDDGQGKLKKVWCQSIRYVESDAKVVNDLLREVGGKQNILVMNDEAHHAYRIHPEEDESDELTIDEALGDESAAQDFVKGATVWIEGLDKVNRLRGINFCLDLSATPYFLGRAGKDTNRPFPWVVSEFGLIDAIESGLVKIPQLAVRDTTGSAIPGYFNIWHWILPQLTSSERGGRRAEPKPEAILKFAHHPIAMLAGLWQKELDAWESDKADPRPPVFIIVCKNTKLAKLIFEWIGENNPPPGIPSLKIAGFLNNGQQHTIRVDSKAVTDTDNSDASKSDEERWMRFTLDTVGKIDWPRDRQGRPVFPAGFEDLAKKLERPTHPPGKDVRCIVSVAMLTEGWDCNTVTHIVGLRPFMSQLLCEQVVGRGLRRASYDVDAEGKFTEEVAKIFGVPFEVIPFKANPTGPQPPPPKRHHITALPERADLEIHFPRVDGYTQSIRNGVAADWKRLAPLYIEPGRIPPEVQVKGLSVNNQGRMSLVGPGRLDDVTLAAFREQKRLQELVFEMARSLTRDYCAQPECQAPAHVLFPQFVEIIDQYVETKVMPLKPADKKDAFLSPYYGWVVERLTSAIIPSGNDADDRELPRFESHRGKGSTADVDYWTTKEVREVQKSHVNYVVADTKKWEQQAAFVLDRHSAVHSFVKNAGLGFFVPYTHNGERHDYIPDFLVRLNSPEPRYLILETKGWDPLEEVKSAAAHRWTNAINVDGCNGSWTYGIAKLPEEVHDRIEEATNLVDQTA